MTVKEFSNQFDIRYNAIASNSAPGIDLYEKSVYLTMAQLEIVNNYFNPKGNKYQEGFEQSSKRRADLKELIRPGISNNISDVFDEGDGISPNSQFFKIPDTVYLIIQEKARITSTDSCLNNKYLKVVPKTHDEFNTQEKNPFKNPNEDVIWRFDMYSKVNIVDEEGASKSVVELISPYVINQYKFRYIIYPNPIILVDLNNSFPGEGLSIEGKTTLQECKLGNGIHNEILNRAVELATVDYNKEDLQIKAQMNLRNE